MLIWPIHFRVTIWEHATLASFCHLTSLCLFCREKPKGNPASPEGVRSFSHFNCASCGWLELNPNPIFALLAGKLRQPCPQQTMFPQSHRGIISPFLAEISRITSVCIRSRTWELLAQEGSPELTCHSRKVFWGHPATKYLLYSSVMGWNSCSIFQVSSIKSIYGFLMLIMLELGYPKMSSIYILPFPHLSWFALQTKGSPRPGKHLT